VSDAEPNAAPDAETLAAYFDLLRIPSVGADPLHLRDCVQCALWIKKWLAPAGFVTELLQPPGHLGAPPIVLAERPGTEESAPILVYGHYDVQPADPLEAWTSPPFEPTVRGARVYARGAQDDKGQWFFFLRGLLDLIAEGRPLPPIKILLEGQEESGSAALTALAPTLRERLRAQVMFVCDTGAAADLRPAIVAGLRGVGHFTLRLTAANRDLHSGEYGGIAPNPAQGLAELIASLHAPDGSIAVKGFADGVIPPTDEERAAAESAATDAAAYAADIGCEPAGGETHLSPVERNSFRPTLEVNGFHSGYGGPGAKTVIPAEAVAKMSMRLVPGQNPSAALAAVERHLAGRVPRGMTLSVEEKNPGAPALRLPLASPAFRLAAAVLEELDPRGAVFQWDGASIPVVSVLKEVSGAAPVIVGFGQPEDRIHSPDESYGFRQMALARAWGRKVFEAFCA